MTEVLLLHHAQGQTQGFLDQALTQTRPGALGALLLHSAVPTASFASPWPAGTPAQMHAMDSDEWAEVPIMKEVAAQIHAELFLYPGTGHLFADTSSEDYDEQAATLLMQRTLAFLDSVG
ncbi:MAG TPA: dienelactone hydrolase family protein [Micromonospora sp.]|nr:dienelactone hydrolase family protein [Micromonospora sp.]